MSVIDSKFDLKILEENKNYILFYQYDNIRPIIYGSFYDKENDFVSDEIYEYLLKDSKIHPLERLGKRLIKEWQSRKKLNL